MNKKHEFKVQIKSFRWKNYFLIIRENDFQLKKEKKKYYYTYSLENAAVFDVSDKDTMKIMVSSSLYKLFIKPLNMTDKNLILSSLEKIVTKKAAKTAFSNNYFEYKKEIAKTEEKNPYNVLLFKLNTFQILKDEISNKMTKFKTTIQQKLSGNLSGEFISIYNEINTILLEMGKQFDKIINAVNKYFLVRNDKSVNDDFTSSSSDDENNIIENRDTIKERKSIKSSQSLDNLLDYYNPHYDFKERLKLDKNIKCPENIIKEMIATFTKKGSAFIIGEIFTNINRFLKPFSPIVGETFEYYINSKKFRYYAENVKHKPQITAFFGESPDWSYYGDSYNETSFKFLKGSLDITFINKIHVIFKNSKNHYVYNMPIVSVKFSKILKIIMFIICPLYLLKDL